MLNDELWVSTLEVEEKGVTTFAVKTKPVKPVW
jgi:hypothetical protein